MNNKNKRIVDCAILSALAIVLQLVSTLLKQVGVSLTLALVPVMIACVTLKWYGLIVSGALGGTILVQCIVGADIGGNIMFIYNPVFTVIGSVIRLLIAAAVLVLIINATEKFNESKWRSILVSALMPVLNTGIFVIMFITMFNDLLYEWAGATDAFTYIIVTLVGINFIVELGTCVLICPPILYALQKVKNSRSV